jgi:putative hemolysin
MVTEQIIILFALLVLSGFFSSSEIALFSISRTKVRYLAEQGDKSFKLIRKMKEDPHKLLSTILIGNNVVNVGAAALATSITIGYFPNYAVGVATGVMTLWVPTFIRRTGASERLHILESHSLIWKKCNSFLDSARSSFL